MFSSRPRLKKIKVSSYVQYRTCGWQFVAELSEIDYLNFEIILSDG